MASVFVTLELDEAAIRRTGKDSGVPELMRRANRVRNRAQELVGVDSGTLRASITLSPARDEGDDVVVRVGTNVDYAIYHHEGVGLYGRGGLIRPVRAKVLRWQGAGGSSSGYVFRPFSRGYPGTKFLERALPAFGS